MDELTDQLRAFGAATEAAVEPATSTMAPESDQATDIGIGPTRSSARLRGQVSGKRPAGKLLAVAAGVVMLGLVSIAFVNRSSDEAELDTASTGQSEDRDPPFTTDNGWDLLRECESSGDYTTDTGNSFYGAYQLPRPVWNDIAAEIGLDGYVGTSPAEAPIAVQDVIAGSLHLRDGTAPWPVCGRHIEGPMITPIVPQWLPAPDELPPNLLVFIEPDASEEQIEAVEAQIRRILSDPAPTRIDFVDKAAALAEYRSTFDDHSEMAEAVDINDMPPSFRIVIPAAPADVVAELEALPSAFAVVDVGYAAGGITLDRQPQRLVIRRLGVDTPVVPTIDRLSLSGAVGMRLDPGRAVIIGRGSVQTITPFARLDEAEPGDVIELQTLVDASAAIVTVRRVEVADVRQVEVSELATWSELDTSGITLVTDVAGNPSMRLRVITRPASIDGSAFGLESDN